MVGIGLIEDMVDSPDMPKTGVSAISTPHE
jgi:hypothetical protein